LAPGPGSGEGGIGRRWLYLSTFLKPRPVPGPGAKARDAIHIVFAGEKVRPDYELPAPEVSESRPTATFQVLNLDALVRMKLTSFRRTDQVHILDLIQVGLVDASWRNRLPGPLAERLQELIDSPEG
jgi:hypothetical protein